MQHTLFSRARRVFLPAIVLLAGCSNANNPYAKIEDGPLTRGILHTVTLVTDGPALAGQIQQSGYAPLALAPNYQAAIRVESVVWSVPEDVAAKVAMFKGAAGAPDLRVLVMPLPAAPAAADAATVRDFYRNVIGVDVPAWPANVARADNVRVHAWTYLVPDILDVKRKLRAHAIAALTEPVGITSTYLGSESVMSLRAPDGAVIELVQAAAQ